MKDKYTSFVESRREIYENRDKCPLEGDVAALQFINTLHRRETDRKEYLTSYDHFIDWAYDAGVVDEQVYQSLCAESYCYYAEAASVFKQVISFRECLRDLVICLQQGVAPYAEQVGQFNRYYDEVKTHRGLVMNGYGMYETWINVHQEIAFPLWKLIRHAAEFLAVADESVIKKCTCGNLFIDRSKTNNRRWCNALTCGKAHWSRAYYSRKKALVLGSGAN